MTLSELLATFIGKNIHVTMTGAGSPLPGKLTACDGVVFTMETRWSRCQYFDINKLITFWAE
jgi:hypothetical protein